MPKLTLIDRMSDDVTFLHPEIHLDLPLLRAVREASEAWKDAFNEGNAAGCAAQYAENAVMHARPFGTFTGREAIQAFWSDLISKGFAHVRYTDQEFDLRNDQSLVLKARWKMNNATGVIHSEVWELDGNGRALLIHDDFEVDPPEDSEEAHEDKAHQSAAHVE